MTRLLKSLSEITLQTQTKVGNTQILLSESSIFPFVRYKPRLWLITWSAWSTGCVGSTMIMKSSTCRHTARHRSTPALWGTLQEQQGSLNSHLQNVLPLLDLCEWLSCHQSALIWCISKSSVFRKIYKNIHLKLQRYWKTCLVFLPCHSLRAAGGQSRGVVRAERGGAAHVPNQRTWMHHCQFEPVLPAPNNYSSSLCLQPQLCNYNLVRFRDFRD